jgi:hypothetical protein
MKPISVETESVCMKSASLGSTPSDHAVFANGETLQRSTEEEGRDKLLRAYFEKLHPSFKHHWNQNQLLFMKRQTLSRVLYWNHLYQLILDKPGYILEFGVQWGSSLNTLINLRGTYEPFNHSRCIFGFDTFEGLAGVDPEVEGDFAKNGDYRINESHESVLEEILCLQESFSPISHLKKFELIKGDASNTFKDWADRFKGGCVAMAIFDMDLYRPTRDVLEQLRPFLFKGSVLVFDEFTAPHWPGEAMALKEVFGLNNVNLRRHPGQPYCAWMVVGD